MSETPERRRVLYYSNDSYGLGHIRTTLAVASELARRRPEISQLIITGSLQAHGFELPDNADYVKLPSVGKGGMFSDLPTYQTRHVGYRGLWHIRAALIREAARQFAPHLVFVDWSPTGHVGELRATLVDLAAARPRPTFVLGFPDLQTDPADVDKEWARLGVRQAMAEYYDYILIFGDRRVYDPVQAYAFLPAAVERTHFLGYVARAEPRRAPDDVRAELGAGRRPLVVVTVGGGADGAPTIRTYLDAVRAGLLGSVVSFVVSGPLLPDDVQTEFAEAAGSLPDTRLIPFTNDLISYLNAADLVITRGGYNTAAEVLSLGKRMIIVPRPGRWREQELRAERLVELGIARLLPTGTLTPDELAACVHSALSEPPPSVPLELAGLARAGELLDDLL